MHHVPVSPSATRIHELPEGYNPLSTSLPAIYLSDRRYMVFNLQIISISSADLYFTIRRR